MSDKNPATTAPTVREQAERIASAVLRRRAASPVAPSAWPEYELTVALRRDNARLAQLLAEIRRLTLRARDHAEAVHSTNRIAHEEADRADGHWDSEWDDARGNESRADFLLDALTSLVRQIEAREAAHDPEPAITSIPLSRGYLRHPCQ